MHYPYNFDNKEYEEGSQVLGHVIPPRQCCHPCSKGLATGLEGEHAHFDCTSAGSAVPLKQPRVPLAIYHPRQSPTRHFTISLLRQHFHGTVHLGTVTIWYG